uniref:Uncharacterized protein n=1 Tax=Peronospora matthiolae TaxID=2874970 RepID=A0AAV1U1U1_9STRA
MDCMRIGGRIVRVAEVVPTDEMPLSVIRTTGKTSITLETANALVFAGLVEVLYARNVWLAARADIWTTRGSCCFCRVKCVSVYLQESTICGDKATEFEVTKTSQEKVVTALQKSVHKLQWNVSSSGHNTAIALTRDELTNVLVEVAQRLVDAFQAVQVQTVQASASPRAKFEYELLRQFSGLDVVVLKHLRSGGHCVLFALPLFGEIAPWDSTKALMNAEDVDSVYLPESFDVPNVCGTADELTICLGYPLDDDETTGIHDDLWPLFVEWPARMLLSSQVTQLPPSSETTSSVELVDSCKTIVLQQWRRRKNFIGELRCYVTVLEYDAVDFSQVFFVMQEQLNEQAPLRIIVLRLKFTAAFFVTNCMSDLRVTLLDGKDGIDAVAIVLAASHTPISLESVASSQACVAEFLGHTQKGLLRHFYEK